MRPALVIADPVADGVAADAGPRRERDERARARDRGALHADGQPGRRAWRRCARRADRGAAFRRRSRSATDLALGALLAGYASGVAGFAVHHAVCQTIVRVAGTPHAQTNAVMLPHFVRMMEPRAPEAIGQLVAARSGRGASPGSAADAVPSSLALAGVTRLAELASTRERLPEVVAAVARAPGARQHARPAGARPSSGSVLERGPLAAEYRRSYVITYSADGSVARQSQLTVGPRIRALREGMDLSLRDLAERSGRLGADALPGRAGGDQPDAVDREPDRRRASSSRCRSCCGSTRATASASSAPASACSAAARAATATRC